jgi:hypothetical protein
MENVFNKMDVKQKKVQFNNDIQIIPIPYEDRKGIWMQYAIDRAHFKRTIEIVTYPTFKSESAENA